MALVCPFHTYVPTNHNYNVDMLNMAEALERLHLLTDDVQDTLEHDEDNPHSIPHQLTDVLQELSHLGEEIQSHKDLQDARWKLVESLTFEGDLRV
jgi:uncharacterized alpha-E superfamily protein